MSMYFPHQAAEAIYTVFNRLSTLFTGSEKVEDLSDTQTQNQSPFYIPPHLDLSTLPKTSLEKIKELKQKPDVAIGISAVRNIRDNSLTPIFFKVFRTKPSEQLSTIKAYHLDTNEEIGAALIGEEEYLEKAYVLGPPEELTHYLENSESKKVRFIYLNHIENKQRERFKNVGAVLFKAVLQYYKDSYAYRLKLESVRENATLYYKLGCVVSEKKNQFLEAEIVAASKSVKSNKNWGPVYMAMSKAGIEHWEREIKESPIRFPDDE